jgi:hypothetical protein
VRWRVKGFDAILFVQQIVVWIVVWFGRSWDVDKTFGDDNATPVFGLQSPRFPASQEEHSSRARDVTGVYSGVMEHRATLGSMFAVL